MSLTPTRSRVMQASRSVMLERPPKASTRERAKSLLVPPAAVSSAVSSSRPGVFRFRHLISQLNTK
jgi:hypothetical protein